MPLNPHIEHLYKESEGWNKPTPGRYLIDGCENEACVAFRKTLDKWTQGTAEALLELMERILSRSPTATTAHRIGGRIGLVYSIILKFKNGIATYDDRELLGNVERRIIEEFKVL